MTTRYKLASALLEGRRLRHLLGDPAVNLNNPVFNEEWFRPWEEVEAERTVSPGKNGSRFSIKVVLWERGGECESQWAHWSMKGRKDD